MLLCNFSSFFQDYHSIKETVLNVNLNIFMFHISISKIVVRHQLVWDDAEEQRYREWLREMDQLRADEKGKLYLGSNNFISTFNNRR